MTKKRMNQVPTSLLCNTEIIPVTLAKVLNSADKAVLIQRVYLAQEGLTVLHDELLDLKDVTPWLTPEQIQEHVTWLSDKGILLINVHDPIRQVGHYNVNQEALSRYAEKQQEGGN